MKLATLRQGAAVIDGEAAHLLPMPLDDLIPLGLERALEVGGAALLRAVDRVRRGRPAAAVRAEVGS